MNLTILWNAATTLLTLIGIGSIIGGIIVLFVGRWLSRGRPQISLIQVESGTRTRRNVKAEPGEKPAEIGARRGSKTSTVQISDTIIQASEKFIFFGRALEEEIDLRELGDFFSIAKGGAHDLQEALTKAEVLYGNLDHNNSEKTQTRVMKRLLADSLLNVILTNGIRSDDLKLPPVSKERAHPFVVEIQTDIAVNHDAYIFVDYPSPNYQMETIRLRTPFLSTDKDRYIPLIEMIKHCDCLGLEQSLKFIIDKLREQQEIANQLINDIEPRIQSIYWQVEVIAHNRGDRTVLLSPYAALITKSPHELPLLPLTALENKRETNPKETKGNVQKEDENEDEFAKNIVLKPQKIRTIRFLADLPGSAADNYSKLADTYNAGIIDCSIILKREDIRDWQGHPLTLRSDWVEFGNKIADNRRKEIVEIAQQTTLRQSKKSRSRQDS